MSVNLKFSIKELDVKSTVDIGELVRTNSFNKALLETFIEGRYLLKVRDKTSRFEFEFKSNVFKKVFPM
jgi:hypothetical protein